MFEWLTDLLLLDEIEELLHLSIKALKKYLSETPTVKSALHLTIKGNQMANYQLNAGDSVVVTITDTDDATGLAVTIDASSVTAVLSSSTDSVVIDPSGTFLTITAGATPGTGNTVTVNATSDTAPSTSVVGTYDVVADVVTSDQTSLSLSFGTEVNPATPLFNRTGTTSTGGATGLSAGTVTDAAGNPIES
jgi:hypothetical protein